MAEQATNETMPDAAIRLRTHKDAATIITGGASGIGGAPLEEEISKRGARAVLLVDL